jgi:hypothetical protein
MDSMMNEQGMAMTVLEEFRELGKLASYCFADDCGREWKQGYEYQNKAQKMYDAADSETQEDMRDIAVRFLWILKN